MSYVIQEAAKYKKDQVVVLPRGLEAELSVS
jgi:hypothetical protein